MKIRLEKLGNSLVLCIPESFATRAGLRKEMSVDVSIENGKLIITPVAEPKLTIRQLLGKATKENTHREVDTGRPRGKETW